MRWLALSLAGPTLWAVLFVIVYALHGAACAGTDTPPETLSLGARGLMIAAWALGLGAHAVLLKAVTPATRPAIDAGLAQFLPYAGAWIGLGASLFTLFPVLILTSC